ncbi:hypothetical protein HRI_002672100 [Hibiscus trionum]|uniref:Uncharacterized protein n=1 Tax=Hibiscus trionum TaxID=183268 RepID=A0A9W7I6V4_HIBTR|nr:hypothetical protein HRI_002672100 [Hibiscus trionum]
MGWNYMNKESLKFLGLLPSLIYLDLSFNSMEGPLLNIELANLNNLKVLNLNRNDLNGTLTIHELTRFTRFELQLL